MSSPGRQVATLALVVLGAMTTVGCGGDPPVAEERPASATVEQATPTPAPAPFDPAAPAQVRHEVQAGDTLWDIAARHGTTAEAIVAVNPVQDPDSLTVGDVLVIPPAEPTDTAT